MRIKSGEGAARLTYAMALAVMFVIIDEVYKKYGDEAIITSGIDGKHSVGSLHYAGAALDFRTRELSSENQQKVRDEIKERLGDDFDVILESNHLHVEWQPKQAY